MSSATGKLRYGPDRQAPHPRRRQTRRVLRLALANGTVRLTAVVLSRPTDWDGFRAATRAHILAGTFNVSRALVELAQAVILARDPERFALLYRLFWRYHRGERQLMEQATDPDLHRATRLAQSVRRDMHNMRAFVRFRAVQEPDGTRYVAWFEPEHYIVEANAGFFARRFAAMAWSILTPDCSAHWDLASLTFGPGADPSDVPDDDALEAYWRARFSAIFNPARLTGMLSDTRGASWRNLTDPAAIPDPMRSAAPATDPMPEQDMRDPTKMPLGPVRTAAARAGTGANDTRLARAAHEAAECRRCDLWQPATQTVFGEGPPDPRIMFVGEQPGDQEDLAGRPFVGPAGQILDRALEEAGVDRRTVYVTNAVKHFQFVPRGKRRIHAKPDSVEIVACQHWLDIERDVIRPALIVLLGATAARAVLGRMVTISRERGERIPLDARSDAFVTVHPSYLLRLPDEDSKAREYRAFVADLRKAAKLVAA